MAVGVAGHMLHEERPLHIGSNWIVIALLQLGNAQHAPLVDLIKMESTHNCSRCSWRARMLVHRH